MGLKIHLVWFDKQTEEYVGEEYSLDLGDDDSIIEETINPEENIINNGCFDMVSDWVSNLQNHIKHNIEFSKYDYQVSFDYRDEW
ncbi:colicin E3-like toxin immunity protein [Providencia rettgeri]|uniref:Cloacin n=1 Tax=Providencia rettgeri TaxID=587 RepID=A0A264VS62_PRORE|nr:MULTISPECIES: colicin E3-like toxin immunity protein [Providencia]MRF68698.1 cloacin [Escherichia coli]MBJ9973354.1 cloacin [Providencia rettgeri]MCF8965137.1 Colicin-E3 immunity protein [Providencia rettgeri]MDB9568798.1 colicin E3-like toxin immunity protein [Providencia rettgeri]OZS74200.1 cloacin [Providencia rettgeri]